MGGRNHGMLTAVSAGDQRSGDERPRHASPGSAREALRFANEAVQIERRSGGPVGILAKAKTKLDRRVGQGATRTRVCHPDEASIASGRRWLLASGQLRASEAGTGSW